MRTKARTTRGTKASGPTVDGKSVGGLRRVARPEKPSAHRSQIKRSVDLVSDERLRSIADFVRHIDELEPWESTEELLRIPGLLESHERGLKDIAAGRAKPWREVLGDV